MEDEEPQGDTVVVVLRYIVHEGKRSRLITQ